MQRAQKAQKAQANKYRREEDFDVGTKVFILKDGWHTDRLNRKLDTQLSSLQIIIERIGNAYKLDLPEHWNLYPVFHADRLKRCPDNLLPKQQNKPNPPEEIDGNREQEVEQILALRIYCSKLQYRAKQQGYDEDPDYYDIEGFKNSPYKLRQYYEEYPGKPGPPKRLKEWLTAWENDELI